MKNKIRANINNFIVGFLKKISDYKYNTLNKKLLEMSDSVELDTESDIKGKVNLKQASKYTGLCYGTFFIALKKRA